MFKAFLAALILLPALMVCNALQMASLVVLPFAPKFFRRWNRFVANAWWAACDLWAEKLNETQVIFSGDELPIKENAIVILNHQGLVDIPVVFRLARRKKRLGDMKWFVKDILKYVPGIGWGMLFLDCLFVKRNWLADQNLIKKVFEKIIRYQVPCWIMSFVEGTRKTPKKLTASQEYALKNKYEPTKHLLIPRTKGFVATVGALKNHVKAVYDFTIGYAPGVPSVADWMGGEVKKVCMHVRRFELNQLPQKEDELADWLRKLFLEKDQLLIRFHQTGSFK